MKAKLLFTIILTFLSVSLSKAQSWVQNDAVWHYDYYMTGYGFYKVSLGNDTIIAGRTCQRYITEKHQFFPQPGNVFVAGPVVDYPQRFTSVSGDTVFHYENDTFYTLFNFGASVGDQWVINDNYSHFNCDSVSKVKVIETDVLTINGTSRRAIRLTTIEGSPKGIEGWVVENIGPIDAQYLFPTDRACYDSTMIVDFETHNFKCFQDAYINLYNPSGVDCEYLKNHAGTQEQTSSIFKHYPNPVDGVLKIEFKSNGNHEVKITDLKGKTVIQEYTTNEKAEIDLSRMLKGVYFIHVINEQQEYSYKRIVKL